MVRNVDPLIRFKSKIFLDTLFLHKNSTLDPCWLWTAGRKDSGYATFDVNGKTVRAHKWYWEQLNGPVPIGFELDHLCKIRHCVNPEHLELVSHYENLLRSSNIMILNAKKTHCSNGHEYTLESTRLYQGRRYCKLCNNNLY